MDNRTDSLDSPANDPSSSNDTRRQCLTPVRSVVIKLGTQLLADQEGRLDEAFLANVAAQVAGVRQRGIQVTVVSSGAIGAGLRELGLPKRPSDLARLQAVAAVGQRRLMDAWGVAFAPYKLPVAQILLTREDIEHRARFLNLRNTIHAIHELGAVPIINENDTISTDELVRISFGDNDILAALVTHALRAHLLVLMTVVDGLLDAEGNPVRLVESIEEARRLVRIEKSALVFAVLVGKQDIVHFPELVLITRAVSRFSSANRLSTWATDELACGAIFKKDLTGCHIGLHDLRLGILCKISAIRALEIRIFGDLDRRVWITCCIEICLGARSRGGHGNIANWFG